jgi:membrane protein required for colicin V production
MDATTIAEEASMISGFDAAVLFILVVSGLISLSRGFTAEALNLAAVAGSIIVTIMGGDYLTAYMLNYVSPEFMATAISYAIVGILSLMIFKTIANKIGSMVKESSLGLIDRTLGGLFGFIRGVLIISFAHLLVNLFTTPSDYDFFKNAKSRPLIEYGSSMLSSIKDIKKDHNEVIEDLKAGSRLIKRQMSSFPVSNNNTIKYDAKIREEFDQMVQKTTKEK